jgi:hypothetical protein
LQKQYKNRKCKYQLKVKIEKAYRLGKQGDDILKRRPVVVELTKFSDREMITASWSLNTDLGRLLTQFFSL